jgi:hypothetical protein
MITAPPPTRPHPVPIPPRPRPRHRSRQPASRLSWGVLAVLLVLTGLLAARWALDSLQSLPPAPAGEGRQ